MENRLIKILYCTARPTARSNRMNKLSNGNGIKRFQRQRSWLFDAEPYDRTEPLSPDDVTDNVRLKQALKRSVANINAPRHLITAIRNEIRK